MGVIALGIGFATPLALAGVVVHIAGHAVAKALGFYAATPLLGARAARRRARGHRDRAHPARARRLDGPLARGARGPAALAALRQRGADRRRRLPGRRARGPAAAATILLALGFLGLAHALIETTVGKAHRRDPGRPPGFAASPCSPLSPPFCCSRWRPRLLAAAHRPRRRAAEGDRVSSRAGSDTYRERIAAALSSRLALRRPARRSQTVAPCARCSSRTDGSTRLEDVAAADGEVPSIVDLVPAADWDEREAFDLYGVRFAGHEPLRPLVDHDLRLDRWTVPVRGHDAYQVAVGPIHAGRDRVRPLPLPRRRRPHPAPRRAALLQAPRPRAGGRGEDARRGPRLRRRAPAPPAPSRTASPTRTPARRRSGSRRPPELARVAHDPARARADVEPPQRHRRRLRRCGPRRRQQPLRRAHRACAPAQRRADRPSLPLRHASGSAAATSTLDGEQVRGRPRRARARSGWRQRAAGASCSSTPRSRTGCRTSASSPREAAAPPRRRRAGGPRGRASPRTSGPRLAAARLRGLRARRARARQPATCRRDSSSGRLELWQSFALLDALLDGPVAPGAARRRAARNGRSASAASRARAARRAASSSATATGSSALRLRTGSYANWPVVALRRRRQPAARLPADQQELRALLRLRGSLMLTLLRDLRRLRREIGLAAPRPRSQPRDPPRRRRLVQRLRARAHARVEPVLRPAALRPRHRRLAAPRRRAARHRPRDDPHARAAPRRLRRDARAAPRRRARRLRARLQRPRHGGGRRRRRSRRCFLSICGSRAARRRRRRSPRRSSP